LYAGGFTQDGSDIDMRIPSFLLCSHSILKTHIVRYFQQNTHEYRNSKSKCNVGNLGNGHSGVNIGCSWVYAPQSVRRSVELGKSTIAQLAALLLQRVTRLHSRPLITRFSFFLSAYANQGSNTISVINATANKVVATIPVGIHPTALVMVNESMLYVANSGSGTVSIINATANKVVATIPVGIHPTD
jgi:YVTN family beta-propeller protein